MEWILVAFLSVFCVLSFVCFQIEKNDNKWYRDMACKCLDREKDALTLFKECAGMFQRQVGTLKWTAVATKPEPGNRIIVLTKNSIKARVWSKGQCFGKGDLAWSYVDVPDFSAIFKPIAEKEPR